MPGLYQLTIGYSKDVGGGRIIGEGCHFVDLLRFLVGSKIKIFKLLSLVKLAEILADNVINLLFLMVLGTIHYLANGNRSFQKERIEVSQKFSATAR